MVSGGGLNAAVEADYKKAGIEDSPQLHTKQTMAAGDFRADPALVATLCENVPQSVEWLKKVGVQFKPGIYQSMAACGLVAAILSVRAAETTSKPA